MLLFVALGEIVFGYDSKWCRIGGLPAARIMLALISLLSSPSSRSLRLLKPVRDVYQLGLSLVFKRL